MDRPFLALRTFLVISSHLTASSFAASIQRIYPHIHLFLNKL